MQNSGEYRYNSGVLWGIFPIIEKNKILMNTLKLSFTGEYSNFLDQKNRLSIPAKFRSSLDPVNDKRFIITKGFDRCLVLYPLYEWNKVEQQLIQLPSADRNFVRNIVRYASACRFDSQGRIALPSLHIEYANIKKEIIVIGMINKIELWSPEEIEKEDVDIKIDKKNDFEDFSRKINF